MLISHQEVNVGNLCGGALVVSDEIMFVWEHQLDIQSSDLGRKGVWSWQLALNSV